MDITATAKDLFQAAVDRADPAQAVAGYFAHSPLPALETGGRYFVVALGKAAVPMMRAALNHIPEPRRALVVTNPENMASVEGAKVMAGSHPVPDEASAKAGRAILDFVSEAEAKDHVIALVSGGGSALAIAPSGDLSLADKAAVNQLLLASGLEINQMNLVRQQLSDLKGGGVLRAARPAPVHALILSDVIGDDLRAIASGPTVAPLSDRAGAKALLENESLWDAIPEKVQHHLSQPVEPLDLPASENILIGSNRHSLDAMAKAARKGGDWDVHIVSDQLVGDVADAAQEVIAAAKAVPTDRPVALLFGGETTVQLRGTGRGGRNQELAARVAKLGATELSGNWVFLSGGTDGRDGPTDAAGGLVDGTTWARIGAEADALLQNNDSYAALEKAEALLMTGGTGTNVADVQILLMMPAS
ncbi:glycerate kinase type-2 family protein [Epibacterium ulvae]|uniref:glycerate kinase type-2 family protein n=1 Tax=Epibacterium ulvae TaxID=1156985 RepID=UPI002492AC26|nr:DUF4147 domain-containing protein [Epibacterium ulvae]